MTRLREATAGRRSTSHPLAPLGRGRAALAVAAGLSAYTLPGAVAWTSLGGGGGPHGPLLVAGNQPGPGAGRSAPPQLPRSSVITLITGDRVRLDVLPDGQQMRACCRGRPGQARGTAPHVRRVRLGRRRVRGTRPGSALPRFDFGPAAVRRQLPGPGETRQRARFRAPGGHQIYRRGAAAPARRAHHFRIGPDGIRDDGQDPGRAAGSVAGQPLAVSANRALTRPGGGSPSGADQPRAAQGQPSRCPRCRPCPHPGPRSRGRPSAHSR